MGSGFKINKHGIEQMTREIQREFDRHPVSVPLRADAPELTRHETIHNGPVINIIGDRAQVSWGNDVSVQNQAGTDLVASGFEQIAQAIAATLNDLPSLGLPEVDLAEADEAGRSALSEVTQHSPDLKSVRHGVAILKGALASIAVGANVGITDSARTWAKTAINQLIDALR